MARHSGQLAWCTGWGGGLLDERLWRGLKGEDLGHPGLKRHPRGHPSPPGVGSARGGPWPPLQSSLLWALERSPRSHTAG